MLGATKPMKGRSAALGQRGLSIIELMVGMTVGLIVVAGATAMMVNQLTEHHRLSLETQVQQDLRASGDLVLQELRRSGYWEQSQQAVWAPSAPVSQASDPYGATSPAVSTNGVPVSSVSFDITAANRLGAGKGGAVAETLPYPSTPLAAATYGFSIDSAGTLYATLGALGAQPLNDPNTLYVSNLSVALNLQTVDLTGFCTQTCTGNQCPQQQVRLFKVVITGHATSDSKVVRTVTVSSRLRNDFTPLAGSCG